MNVDNNLIDEDGSNPIVEVYRIAPEVRKTMLQALEIYEQLPIQKNVVFIARAKNDLNLPMKYDSSGVQAPAAAPANTIPDTMEAVNLKNIIDVTV
jgi:hypothetical protein